MTRWQFPTDQLTPDEIALVIRLDAAIGALDPERLRADFRTAVATLVLLAAQSDAREGERVGGGGGPSDSVWHQMLGRLGNVGRDEPGGPRASKGPLTALQEITAEGTEAIAHLSLLGRRVGAVRLVADGPALEAARKQARCTPKPEEALEAWAWDIATCQENAVKDGLCGKHYMRRWRARSSAA